MNSSEMFITASSGSDSAAMVAENLVLPFGILKE
ncbi:hypothetical protein A2U01_0082147, partial [Trifolium medium]|nr:hypothetical protein [Trifolium medium]